MHKLVLLPLLVLPACASGENARLAQAAFAHAQTVCADRGNPPGSDGYLRCAQKVGHRDGYLLAAADDGALAFELRGEGGAARERGQAGVMSGVPAALQPPR